MKIRLHEISKEGESFEWNEKSAELTPSLRDLVGQAPYSVQCTIRPLNSRDFELTGSVRTQVPEQCSRCGIEIEFPVRAKFHEILIPHQEDDRTSKYSKVNHLSESEASGPSVAEYAVDDTFQMGEYLHEQIAIQIPFNPAPPMTEKGDCEDCGLPVEGRNFSYDEEMPEEKPESPFAALKNLKI